MQRECSQVESFGSKKDYSKARKRVFLFGRPGLRKIKASKWRPCETPCSKQSPSKHLEGTSFFQSQNVCACAHTGWPWMKQLEVLGDLPRKSRVVCTSLSLSILWVCYVCCVPSENSTESWSYVLPLPWLYLWDCLKSLKTLANGWNSSIASNMSCCCRRPSIKLSTTCTGANTE